MNEQHNQESLSMHPESVIQFSKEHFMTGNQGHRTFSLDELTDLLHESIENDINKGHQNWIYTGLRCAVMIPGQDWQQGRLKVRIKFIPDKIITNPELETNTT